VPEAGVGYGDSVEGYSGPRKRIKNGSGAEGRSSIAGSGRTIFDKKELPLGFMRTNHKNSKVSVIGKRRKFSMKSFAPSSPDTRMVL
jgi:hypothetical protein